MKKLSKEKRNQLVLVCLGFGGAVAGIWFMLISPQLEKNGQINKKIQDTQSQIDKVNQVAAEAGQVEMDLKACAARLKQIEDGMPGLDRLAWITSTMQTFNERHYHVELHPIATPVIGEVSMFTSFPYHQFTASVSGSAYYSDLGRFCRDFENKFPHMRLQIQSIEPGAGVTAEEREKLNFRIEVVALIKKP